MKFRKKPIEVEAWTVRKLLILAKDQWHKLPRTIKDNYEIGNIIFGDNFISVTTLEGNMRASLDDWVIKGVKGELYPCKPEIFEATYEPVNE